MKKNPLLSVLFFLFASIALSGCGSDDAGSLPQSQPPLSNQPPAAEPPVDEPPVIDEPPVEEPPAVTPPVDEPPAEQPPVEDPPAEAPPANPPVEEPPAEEPPAGEPPVEEPPAEEPPVATPPVDEPPAEEPPVEDEPPSEEIDALTLDEGTARDGVLPDGVIVLRSARPLDATTVATSVELRNADSTESVPASVAYDAVMQAITIDPAATLNPDVQYAIHIAGARDIDGNAVRIAGQAIARVKKRVYSQAIVYNADGDIASVTIFQPISGTNQARKTKYVSPGDDGNWFDVEDNLVERYWAFEYQPDGVEIEKVYVGPGEGGWFDDNDELDRAYYRHRDAAGRYLQVLQSDDAGADGDLFTNDEDYISSAAYEYDADGKLVRYFAALRNQQSWPLNAGPDGIWMTGDDNINTWHRRVYDDGGRLTHDYQYVHRGSNGRWFSADDLIRDIDAYEYNAAGQLSRRIMYTGAFDGALDGNDYLWAYYRFLTIANARVRELVRVYGPDIDSPGAYLDEYLYEAFDDQARPTAWGFFGSEGDDRAWHTPDDVMQSNTGGIYRYEIDVNGIPEQHVMFIVDNGGNETRFDGDELVAGYYVRSYDETSQLTRVRNFAPVNGPAEIAEGNFWLSFETEYLDMTVE